MCKQLIQHRRPSPVRSLKSARHVFLSGQIHGAQRANYRHRSQLRREPSVRRGLTPRPPSSPSPLCRTLLMRRRQCLALLLVTQDRFDPARSNPRISLHATPVCRPTTIRQRGTFADQSRFVASQEKLHERVTGKLIHRARASPAQGASVFPDVM